MLGFELTQRLSSQTALLSGGGYHHIGLNTCESLGGSQPPPRSTGLDHLAILYPTRSQLADVLRRVLENDISLDGASDYAVSEARFFMTLTGRRGIVLGPFHPPLRRLA